MTRKTSSLALSVLFLAFPFTLHAQLTPNQVTSTNSTGVQPYTPYGGVRENIGLTNGNLNLQVPLLSLPGRKGTDLAVGLEYDSKIWNLSSFYSPYAGMWFYGWQYEKRDPAISFGVGNQFGWRIMWPVLQANNRTRDDVTLQEWCYMDFIVTLADGSKHSFPNRAHCGTATTPLPGANVTSGDSQSGDFMRLDSSNESDLVVHLKDGTRIHFATDFTSGATPYTASASKIEDVNGNYIQGTDTLGRSINFNMTGANLTSITYKDSSGQIQTISFAYATVNVNPAFTSPVSGVSGAPMNSTLLSTITLPNNLTYL